jgi:Contractile injection system tube protein
MERVAFLLEETGERLACMLNPESLTVRRLAGVQARRSVGGVLTGAGLSDDPLLYTGGGMTELHLDLLFDVSLGGSSVVTDDVRQLTGPLWQLGENAANRDPYGRPPLVRFVWGKSWNIPGIVASVAERLEHFTPEGEPMRSWLRMRLLRVAEPSSGASAAQVASRKFPIPEAATTETSAVTSVTPTSTAEEESTVHQYAAAERLDDLAQRICGHPSMWRWLAAFNDLVDPLHIPPGTLLRIPSLKTLEGKQ